MRVETAADRSASVQIRVDSLAEGRPAHAWLGHPAWLWVLTVAWLVLGSVHRDLSADEARLGLSAMERLGPFGQEYGGWDPSILPGRVVPSWLLFKALGEAWNGWPALSMAFKVTSSLRATATMATLAWPLRAFTAW